MSKLEVEFEFEIGDMVYFRTAAHTLQEIPNRHMIVERMAQQCPGGVQLQYRLGNATHWTNEIELSKEMPPYEWSHPERRQESREIRNEEREESDKHWKMAIKAETPKSE